MFRRRSGARQWARRCSSSCIGKSNEL
jgi:hypothetical protein